MSARVFKFCIHNEDNKVYYCKQNHGAEIYICLLFLFFSSPEPKAQGELIVYRLIRRPSVCASVRPSVNIFKLESLRNQWANRNKILTEPSLGWGKGCIRFYLRSPYLIIISAICHCHSFKNELVLVLNTAWRKQPIADYVSNHNRTCGESVSENSE